MKPTTATLLLIAICFTACKKNKDEEPAPIAPLAITSFTPTSGGEGATVIITGMSFSTTAADNIVKFNGTTATVSAATATQITTTVPANATTGKITISANGKTATSATDFTFLTTPVVSSFTPEYHHTADALPDVIITGSNFSSTAANNIVKFNGTTATVSQATSTELTVTLPAEATTGKITVTVQGVTGTSDNDFLIGCPDVIISNMAISNISGNNFTVTYDIKNIGAIPIDLTTYYIQSYVSIDGTQQNVASGGFGDYGASEPALNPNDTRQKVQAISSQSISSYPYVIFNLLSSKGATSRECVDSNNKASKKIE
jgi:hypothetical protein